MKKYIWVDWVLAVYDRKKYLKEAYEANIEYEVLSAVEETTKKVTKKQIRYA